MTAFTDRADTDPRAGRFREIARAASWDVRSDTMPWAEGAGIVHVASFEGGGAVENDSVYTTWEHCCWEVGLSDEAREYSGGDIDIVDVAPKPAP